tara:strand:- start:133 stop:477 length:345 start_codon:yes stop_codon:yes gene_type:complete
MEPIGIYTDIELAMDHLNSLEELTTGDNKEDFFDVVSYKMNTKPDLITLLEEKKREQQELLENALLRLMQRGDIDQVIGEDGEFYYKLTDFGKSAANTLKKKISKFRRRNKKDD